MKKISCVLNVADFFRNVQRLEDGLEFHHAACTQKIRYSYFDLRYSHGGWGERDCQMPMPSLRAASCARAKVYSFRA